MKFEKVIREITKEREDISLYRFCIFKPHIGWGDGYSDSLPDYKPVDATFWISRNEIKEGFMNYLADLPLENEALGITSLVELRDGRREHLGLIDFRCAKHYENLEEVRHTLKNLRMDRGFIMDSGNSYHFIGIDSYSSSRFRELLYSMCGHDVIGWHWPRLQMKGGYAVLRATACHARGKYYAPHSIEKFVVERIKDNQIVLPL